MALPRLISYSILIFLFAVSGCKKEVPKGEMPHGMIALSFDDTYADSWYAALPLLDSLGIKATFYVSAYHTLTPLQKDKLRIIKLHGHEIGYHTTNHANLVKLNKKSGLEAMIRQEIMPDLALMRNDGFDPVDFAYPFGQHDCFLDAQLLHYFKSVRALSNPNYYTSFASHSGARQVFYAMGIDSGSKVDDGKIQNQLRLAAENNDCISLYAHSINDPRRRYQITADRLRFIAAIAKMYQLHFVTVSEISY